MHQRSPLFLISLLGALSVISPFAIDMYLPAFPQMAEEFAVSSAAIALTLSGYFIGMALGQALYGPLLDRFGRKKPLLAGLGMFILASIGCAQASSVEALVLLRFIQGMGGCAAGVASLAMVRDFFPAKDCAKMLSRLFLFIAVSPLLAPSIGGMVMLAVGWRAVFIILACIVGAIMALVIFLLPEGHQPDKSISLRPGPIFREYVAIFKHPRFNTYALSGAFSFAGLFTYLAGSPVIFMEGFQVSPQVYGGIFALLAVGFIGGSQLNVVLLRRFDSEALFVRLLVAQVVTAVIFMVGAGLGWYGLAGTLVLFFIFLSSVGITYPNAAALALEPFSKNAGSAAALLGFLQLGAGALISTGISLSGSKESFPIIAILAVTSSLALVILLHGRKRALASAVME